MEFDVTRLCSAIQKDRRRLERFRTNMVDAVKQYVGSRWNDEGSDKPVPVNLISLFAKSVVPKLVADNPRFMLSTYDRSAKAMVSAMQDWVNEEAIRMNLKKTFTKLAYNGAFSIGIAKVALATASDAERYAWRLKAGRPFVSYVDLDDWVHDGCTRNLAEAGYCGHRFRVPLEIAKNDPTFGSNRSKLTAATNTRYNAGGDEKLGAMSQTDEYTGFDEYEDYVDLWEIYLPRHKKIVTLADDQVTGAVAYEGGEPLKVQDWIGPDSGPYYFLEFYDVPGNAMPKAPVQDIMDNHMFVNRCVRKLHDQTDRVKDLTFVRGAADKDGNAVMAASDGDIIKVENPEGIVQVSTGGANGKLYGMFRDYFELSKQLPGNLDAIAGLSASTKTVGQDKMLNEAATAGVLEMQATMVDFVARVGQGLCWYLYHHPELVMETQFAAPSTPEITIPRKVTPEQRMQSPWTALKIEVNPYSLQYTSPLGRAGVIRQIVSDLLPLTPLLQQRGVMFDANAYVRFQADNYNVPELLDLFTTQEPPPTPGPGGGSGGDGGDALLGGTGGANGGHYIRESVSEATASGQARNVASQMMGVDPGGASE